MTELEKIKKALNKRQMKVFADDEKSVSVFWKDKEKTKFGYINKDYYHRYGVSTSIALLDGSQNPGFASNDYAKSVDQQIVVLLKNGEWSQLPDFSTDMLTTIKS